MTKTRVSRADRARVEQAKYEEAMSVGASVDVGANTQAHRTHLDILLDEYARDPNRDARRRIVSNIVLGHVAQLRETGWGPDADPKQRTWTGWLSTQIERAMEAAEGGRTCGRESSTGIAGVNSEVDSGARETAEMPGIAPGHTLSPDSASDGLKIDSRAVSVASEDGSRDVDIVNTADADHADHAVRAYRYAAQHADMTPEAKVDFPACPHGSRGGLRDDGCELCARCEGCGVWVEKTNAAKVYGAWCEGCAPMLPGMG